MILNEHLTGIQRKVLLTSFKL